MELPPLNLPHAEFRVREDGNDRQIYDTIRKRFVALTPEEWVRQNFLNFLVNVRKYPASLIGVEILVRLNEMSQRADIVVYQRDGKPWLIVECKAPTVTLDEDVFYQAARYNSQLRVPYIALTNGLEHYCLFFNGKSFDYLGDLPDFNTTTD